MRVTCLEAACVVAIGLATLQLHSAGERTRFYTPPAMPELKRALVAYLAPRDAQPVSAALAGKSP